MGDLHFKPYCPWKTPPKITLFDKVHVSLTDSFLTCWLKASKFDGRRGLKVIVLYKARKLVSEEDLVKP